MKPSPARRHPTSSSSLDVSRSAVEQFVQDVGKDDDVVFALQMSRDPLHAGLYRAQGSMDAAFRLVLVKKRLGLPEVLRHVINGRKLEERPGFPFREKRERAQDRRARA